MRTIRPIYKEGVDYITENPTITTVTTWADLLALPASDGDFAMLNTAGDDVLYIWREDLLGVTWGRWIPYEIYVELEAVAENATGLAFYDSLMGETMTTATGRGFDVTGCTDSANGIVVENGDAFDFLGITNAGASKGLIVYIECYGETGTALNLNRINLEDGQRTTQVCFARSAPNQYGLAFGKLASGEGILAPADLYTPCIIRTDHDNDASVMLYGLPNGTSRPIDDGTSTSAIGFYFNDASGTQKTTVKSIFVFTKK